MIQQTRVAALSAIELYDEYSALNFPVLANQPTIAFNMVASVDGVTNVKATPQSAASDRGLGNPVDQKVMRILRLHADCVLNGANTLRISGTESTLEKYPELIEKRVASGKSRNPIAAVVTNNADFTDEVFGHGFFIDQQFSSVLFVSENAPKENLEKVKYAAQHKKLDIVPISTRNDNVKDVARILHDNYKVNVLLVEGGAGINGSFIKNGLADHFFLTESPKIVIASHATKSPVTGLTSLLRDELIELQLRSCYYIEEVGSLFQHWQFVK